LVGIFSWETRLGVEKWTDAGVKACHFNILKPSGNFTYHHV
jgi:hypothetical protein